MHAHMHAKHITCTCFPGHSRSHRAVPPPQGLPAVASLVRSVERSEARRLEIEIERQVLRQRLSRGEEAEQLRVRCRLVQAVRAGLERFGRPWWELPRDLSSWDTLVPGAAAQLGHDAGDES